VDGNWGPPRVPRSLTVSRRQVEAVARRHPDHRRWDFTGDSGVHPGGKIVVPAPSAACTRGPATSRCHFGHTVRLPWYEDEAAS
jgi:hypothetical protein